MFNVYKTITFVAEPFSSLQKVPSWAISAMEMAHFEDLDTRTSPVDSLIATKQEEQMVRCAVNWK